MREWATKDSRPKDWPAIQTYQRANINPKIYLTSPLCYNVGYESRAHYTTDYTPRAL